MKNFISKQQTIEEVKEIVCDRCSTVMDYQDLSGNYVASFKHNFGYPSKYDNDEISFDLCEKCLFEMLEAAGVNYTIT